MLTTLGREPKSNDTRIFCVRAARPVLGVAHVAFAIGFAFIGWLLLKPIVPGLLEANGN